MIRADTLDPQVQSATHRTGSADVIIVADDLTGACDSGVAFLASGRPVRVILNPPAADSKSESQFDNAGAVISYTTETRNLAEAQAHARVAEAMVVLANAHPNAILFKKVDSAARGNFGAEIIAAFNASGANLALVAPAFPHAQRTVHSGVLSVRDCSGQNSNISLRDQFSGLEPTQIEILHTDSEPNLRLAIRHAIANNIRILLCDAEAREDLDRLASAGTQTPKPLLWAGSAGLAHALARTLPTSSLATAPPHASRQGRTLLFSGSPHPVTQLQLSHLEEQSPRLKDAVIRIDSDSPSKEVVKRAFTAEPVASLILTGGDTAAFVLKSLDASGILLTGEIAPGIPWGFVEGGMAGGCIVVTKSGGFGDRDTLVHAFEFCRRRSP